jgi:hypothetical protein
LHSAIGGYAIKQEGLSQSFGVNIQEARNQLPFFVEQREAPIA